MLEGTKARAERQLRRPSIVIVVESMFFIARNLTRVNHFDKPDRFCRVLMIPKKANYFSLLHLSSSHVISIFYVHLSDSPWDKLDNFR